MNEHFSIAIDGPSGAGKSSIAKAAAKNLGFIYVDTGAIYRTVALAAVNRGTDTKDAAAVDSILPNIKIEIRYNDDREQRMFLDGEDVSDEIRRPEISIAASNVAAMAEVRQFLLQMQRSFAENSDVIMDGRDIGTVVLPNANLKIFLSATPEARAHRRTEELHDRGIATSYEEVLKDIVLRDKQDSERSSAPLKAADDAYLLDNSTMSFEDELKIIVSLVQERRDTE